MVKLDYYKEVSKSKFEEIIKRRISKIVRKYKIIKPNQKVEIVNDNYKGLLLLYYFYGLLKNSPIHKLYLYGEKLSEENEKKFKITYTKKHVGDVILLPYSLDDAALDIIKSLVKGKIPKIKVIEGKLAKPLILIPNDEIELFLKFKKIKHKKKIKKEYKLVNNLKKIKKDAEFAMVKFFLDL